jgi:carboxyl-terminal processing protease
MEDFGESTKPNALPWDEIDSVSYDGAQLPDALVEQLSSLHKNRVSEDAAFQSLLEDIEHYRDVQNRNSLSLNIDQRREEQQRNEEQRLARENVRRAARGEAPLDSLDESSGDEEGMDILLMESVHIMADYAAILPDHIEDDSRFVARRYPGDTGR